MSLTGLLDPVPLWLKNKAGGVCTIAYRTYLGYLDSETILITGPSDM